MLSDQNMYQRLAASKSDSNSKKANIGWIIGLIIVTPTISLIAFAASTLFDDIDPGMALMASTLVLPNVEIGRASCRGRVDIRGAALCIVNIIQQGDG